ncbi:MAG: ADP-ribosylglycohydrolase family protein [Sandaracinus sp.]|nr:ADP-ribosylglycohydrolase family protein [Sandaracinus sp.]MCB9624395.1 ADP-ribosylglycohydrolase family protein [Sandaracinus sp.]
MRRSLDGLSVGDAFGECFFGPTPEVLARMEARTLPEGPWPYTDDTEMALSIVAQLEHAGTIEQASLADAFARRMGRRSATRCR